MESAKSHRELIVWQKSMLLARLIYQLSRLMPKSERFELTSQMLRAAVSIPSNIAEGNARSSRKDYARFVSIARGSAAELETQLLLCAQCGLLTLEDIAESSALADEISRMLNALRQKLVPKDDPEFS